MYMPSLLLIVLPRNASILYQWELLDVDVLFQQFVCGLCLSVGQQAQLSREDIGKIAQHYCTKDGRIRYKEFCDTMENSQWPNTQSILYM